jgi:glycosyltransferase involved in cell wall biosynthesis
MKVCLIVSGGLDKVAGLEKCFIDLSNELSKFVQLSVIAHVNYKSKLTQNIDFIPFDFSTSRYNILMYVKLYRIIEVKQFDIIHTHASKATYVIDKLMPFFKKTKLIGTKHNPRKGKIFNKIKYVTAVSNEVAKSINNKNVKVIYNGIKQVDLNKVKNNNKYFTICAIGRLDKIKGFDILIKEVSKLNFDFRLNIVGEGPEKKGLENLIKTYNLESKVLLMGYSNDIPEILNTSDLQIISSISEGFSLVFLEGLFYSKVLISNNVGIIKELQFDDFLITDFKIKDKIKEIYDNYDKYFEKFSEFKILNQEKFILNDIVKDYINFYHFILQKEKKKV